MTSWTDDEVGGTVWSDEESGAADGSITGAQIDPATDKVRVIDSTDNRPKLATVSAIAEAMAPVIPFTQSGSGATSRTAQNKMRERISVLDFIPENLHAGIQARTNSTDLTTYIQAGIDAVEALGGAALFFPVGDYLTTATLTVDGDGVHLVGSGPRSSVIKFAPTANDTCLYIAAGANPIWHILVQGLGIYSSDVTYTKIAIEIVDAKDHKLKDLLISGPSVGGTNTWTDSGDSSIGVYTKGRDMGHFEDLHVSADRPLLMGVNPNHTDLDVDFYLFESCIFVANNNPIIEAQSGVQLTNVKFLGCSLNKGTDGFRWVSTAGTTNPYKITFDNCRIEQGESSSAYNFYIDFSGAGGIVVQDITFNDVYCDPSRHGFYLRSVQRVLMQPVYYAGNGTKTAIDFTAITNSVLMGSNCRLASGAPTFTLTGFVRVFEPRPTQTSDTLGETFLYMPTSRAGFRTSVIATASVPVVSTGNIDGTVMIENMGGARAPNVVVYGNSKRSRIPGEPQNFITQFDDFLGDVLADQWGNKTGSHGSVVAPAVVSGVEYGMVRMTTGADAAGSVATNGVLLQSDLQWYPQHTLVYEVRIKMSAITNVAVFVGFTDQIATLEMPIYSASSADTLTTDASNAVGVMFDTAMSTDNWWQVGVANGVAATAQNSAVAPTASTYEVWRIEVASNGTATFFRNGTQVGTAMTGAAAANVILSPVVAAFSRSNAARNIDMDYLLVRAETRA